MGCLEGLLFGYESSPRPRRVHLDCSPLEHLTLSADLAVLAETRLAARTLSISEMAMMGQTGWEGGLAGSGIQLQDCSNSWRNPHAELAKHLARSGSAP